MHRGARAPVMASKIQALAFVIAGPRELVYETRLAGGREEQSHVHHFVLHSALDLVDEKAWSSPQSFLQPAVDEFNEFHVRAYIAADGARFLLLHEKITEDTAKRTRSEDCLRSFFDEVNELYVKVALNPFYEPDTPITSKTFDQRVLSSATKWGFN